MSVFLQMRCTAPQSHAPPAFGLCLPTWSASNYCQGPGDNSLFLTVSPDFASNLFYDHSGEYGAQASAINYEISSGGAKFTARTAAIEAAKKGKFMYDNQALLIDDDVDPRLKRPLDSASKNPNAIKASDMSLRLRRWVAQDCDGA